jgi:hypothetical protein
MLRHACQCVPISRLVGCATFPLNLGAPSGDDGVDWRPLIVFVESACMFRVTLRCVDDVSAVRAAPVAHGSETDSMPTSAPRRISAATAGIASHAIEPVGHRTRSDNAGSTGPVLKPEAEVDANPFRDMGGSRSPNFNHVLLRETLATMWVPGTENDGAAMRTRAGMAALRAFKPKDEIDGMLAAQAVALHFGAMECLRRAMLPDQPGEFQTKLCKDGVNLARGMADMLDALDRKRSKGRPQVVRVERVVVHDGGRAIVGNVSSGAGAARPPAAIEADPSVPTLDVSRAAVPIIADRGGRGER